MSIYRTKLIHGIQANLTICLAPTEEQLENCLRSLLEKHTQPPSAECQVRNVLRGIAVLRACLVLLKETAVKRRGYDFLPDSLFINEAAKTNVTNKVQ